MVRVIATDLDGTLLRPKKKYSLVEKENKKYIKDFYGDIVLVSGRTPKFCAKICKCLKIHHNFIALNGAVIVKEGKVIYRQSMKKTSLINLIDFIKQNYNNFEILIMDKYDKIYSYSSKSKMSSKLKHLKHAVKNGKLHDKIITGNKKAKKILTDHTEIYKIIIYSDCSDDMHNLISHKFKDHFSFFPSDHSIEISPIGTNKGEALQYLINTTKVKKDEVYVVGDGSNDISMFDLFKNSFAIENAPNYVKIKAKHTISKFSDLKTFTQLNNNFIEDKNEL